MHNPYHNSFHNLPSAFTPLTPTTTPPATSTSSLSSSSSIVSRQSSVRSTTSVVAVPIRKPQRGPSSQPLSRGNSGGGIGQGFDSSSVAVVTSAPTHLPAGTGGSYFAGALNSGAPLMRRGSSGEGGGNSSQGGSSAMLTPTTGMQPRRDSQLSDWTAVNAAVAGVVQDLDETPTRPGGKRAESTMLANPRPTKDRDGSSSSVAMVRKAVGDFTLGETLGDGSYSTVSLVTDKHPPHRSYALKVLDKDHIKREKKTKYVLIERDTLKTLDGHPGIVRLYWTFQDQRSLYYVLELAKNGELLKWIKKFGSFHLPCARFYAAQILSAVEHMHSKGVIHRDLKPENILLDDKMRIKVTDFGTAKQQTTAAAEAEAADPDAPRSRSFVGTPEYVSPEILSERKESSPSSDYWGFGCILYQMLAGRPPFQARTEYLMFQKIINLEYEFPLGFPADAKDLVEKLLVVDPKQRLGGGPEGVAAIKAHPFFTACDPPIDFETIWTIDPPILETGLAEPKKEIKGEFVLLDDFGDSGDDEGAEEWSGGEESGGERGSASLESARDGASSAGLSDDGPKTKWTGVLLPTETIVFASPVLVKKGFITKKRSLILTDFPRLICIKDAPTRVTIKSEVYVGAALKGGITKPGAVAFVKAEKEGDRILVIKTSQRTFKYEEPTGAAGRWVEELKEAHAKGMRALTGR